MEEPSCTRCGVRPRTSYHPWCRQCKNESQNTWRRKNPQLDECSRCRSESRTHGSQCARCHEEKRTDKKRYNAYSRKSCRKLKRQLHATYGRRCSSCGSTENLHLHHVYGDGDKHRKRCGGAEPSYRELRRRDYPGVVRLLCSRCHKEHHERIRRRSTAA